jgi:putative transposase
VLTEAKGIPVGVAVDGANRHDTRLVTQTLHSIPIRRPRPRKGSPQRICMDKAYDSGEIRELIEEFGFTEHIRCRGEEAEAIKKRAGYKARRWVVERTHSWLNRFRRILIRWEKRADTYIAMLHLALGIITWRATGLLK